MYTGLVHQFIVKNFPNYAMQLTVIAQLELLVEKVVFRKNEILFAEGKVVNKIVIIEEGNLMAYATINGVKKVHRFWFKEQSVFLASSLINQAPIHQTVVALNNCSLALLNYNRILQLVEQYPNLWQMINLFNNYENQLLQNHIELLTLTPKTRYQTLMQQHPELIQLITADLLASYLHMGYSTFSRFRQAKQ